MILRIINENEPIYATYLSLLTPLQFKVLRAIALNSEVTNPSSSEFLTRDELGAASSVSQTIKSLEEKELITWSEKKLTLNDQFFMQWLKRK
jgi:DNA-binding MarR family transcriptional regulator